MVCAHRTYPFGTKLLVKNITNGEEVVVTVIDRGPHRRGRIIDLSYAAAEKLGMINRGVVTVEVSIYHPENRIPYALEPDNLPEIDFEAVARDSVDEEDYHPIWTRYNSVNETKKKNIPKTKKTKAKPKTKKSITKKKRK